MVEISNIISGWVCMCLCVQRCAPTIIFSNLLVRFSTVSRSLCNFPYNSPIPLELKCNIYVYTSSSGADFISIYSIVCDCSVSARVLICWSNITTLYYVKMNKHTQILFFLTLSISPIHSHSLMNSEGGFLLSLAIVGAFEIENGRGWWLWRASYHIYYQRW